MANHHSHSVSVFRNKGGGILDTAVSYWAGLYPRIFCADLDGDSALDIAVSNEISDTNNVTILMNDGDSTFYLDSSYAAGDGAHSVFCADLDNDDDLDLAVANENSENISIFKNQGDGTFQAAVNYEAGSFPVSVFCADLDSDNDVDIAVAVAGEDNVAIFINLTDPDFTRGDANGDRVVDIADVVYLINYLFTSGPAPDPLEAGDANCDGTVNIADAVYLINYLFIGGPPPGCT